MYLSIGQKKKKNFVFCFLFLCLVQWMLKKLLSMIVLLKVWNTNTKRNWFQGSFVVLWSGSLICIHFLICVAILERTEICFNSEKIDLMIYLDLIKRWYREMWKKPSKMFFAKTQHPCFLSIIFWISFRILLK